MIRRSVIAVAAVIALSAAAASTQAFADDGVPECTVLVTAFTLAPTVVAATPDR